ncbi:hypothetical protein ACTXT7_011096 [Hymenolepis weldensis]
MAAYVKGFAQFSSSAGWIFTNCNFHLLKIEQFFEHPALGLSLVFQAECCSTFIPTPGYRLSKNFVPIAFSPCLVVISQEETREGSGWSLYDLSRRLLQAIDWAGERLASAVGLTDPKFDVYLWEREYLDKEQAERETNTFVIDRI